MEGSFYGPDRTLQTQLKVVIDDQALVLPVPSAKAPSKSSPEQRQGIAARRPGLQSGDAPDSPSDSELRSDHCRHSKTAAEFQLEAPANYHQVCCHFSSGGKLRQSSIALHSIGCHGTKPFGQVATQEVLDETKPFLHRLTFFLIGFALTLLQFSVTAGLLYMPTCSAMRNDCPSSQWCPITDEEFGTSRCTRCTLPDAHDFDFTRFDHAAMPAVADHTNR